MTDDVVLDGIRELIQDDVNQRGLRASPTQNLVTACLSDFASACRSLADTPNPAVGVVTGFLIPHAQPPAGETDGPLGALFLARAFVPLGIRVVLATDAFCAPALQAGLAAAGLRKSVSLVTLPNFQSEATPPCQEYWQRFTERSGPLTHLIALERVGPSHTAESLRAQPQTTVEQISDFVTTVPAEHHNRCHTMKGRDITSSMSPAHLLFEAAVEQQPRVTTIGIGDGGNEIGMGKIPWDIIRRNIDGGDRVACRVATDYLIVCGISNWGAYGLAKGVRLLRAAPADAGLFDKKRERELLELMVARGPLVDGMSGQPSVSVDGVDFDRYAAMLDKLERLK